MAELPKSPESRGLPLTFIRGPFEPLVIDHAEGAWLYTADGGKILDAAGGAVVINIGQGREEIAQLMAEEVRLANYVVPIWSTPQRQRLVERLARWTPPGLNRFFFTSAGFGGGRGGAQVRADVSQGPRPSAADENNRARGFVSRQHARRALGRRKSAPRGLRARAVRLAENQTVVLLPLSVGQDLPRMRYRLRRGARGGDRAPRRGHDRGIHRGADDGFGGRLGAAGQGILAAAGRDLPAPWRLADSR